MNKLEILDIASSPRSEEPMEHYLEDNESNYSSVPSERVKGDTNSVDVQSAVSPSKHFDPTDGENIESTLRTSHSSPEKANYP